MFDKWSVVMVMISIIVVFSLFFLFPSREEMWSFQIVSIDTEKDKTVLNCQLWDEKEKHFSGDPIAIKTKPQTTYLDLGEAELQAGMIVFGYISGFG